MTGDNAPTPCRHQEIYGDDRKVSAICGLPAGHLGDHYHPEVEGRSPNGGRVKVEPMAEAAPCDLCRVAGKNCRTRHPSHLCSRHFEARHLARTRKRIARRLTLAGIKVRDHHFIGASS